MAAYQTIIIILPSIYLFVTHNSYDFFLNFHICNGYVKSSQKSISAYNMSYGTFLSCTYMMVLSFLLLIYLRYNVESSLTKVLLVIATDATSRWSILLMIQVNMSYYFTTVGVLILSLIVYLYCFWLYIYLLPLIVPLYIFFRKFIYHKSVFFSTKIV